jgi:hypothetical protein
MRKYFKHIIIVLFTSVIFQNGYSQEGITLDSFTLLQSNNSIYVRWVLSSGSTCNGTRLWRSSDSVNYEMMYEITGVCGSPSQPTPYSFVDDKPLFNKKSFYKLEFLGFGFSEPKTIEVMQLKESEYRLNPNPISQNTKLYFSKLKNVEYRLIIYNQFGKKITEVATRTNFFEINSEEYNSGLYLFFISEEYSTIITSGKFIVEK